jgi:NAD(P)H-hydrate epimerase
MIVPPLSRDQVRNVDKVAIDQYGIPGIALMENAGRGAAEIIDRIASAGPIVILCGPGNNGGDGYVIARHLELSGRDVCIVSVAELQRLSGDAETNARIATEAEIGITVAADRDQLKRALASASTIVDCLLGTGSQGPLRGIYADAVMLANEMNNALRIAIDIPTGLDCDTGVAADPTFKADHTITFVAKKIGFEKENADDYVGVVHQVGIGVPAKLLREI